VALLATELHVWRPHSLILCCLSKSHHLSLEHCFVLLGNHS
jgi:hypothetical protein